jgi:hypothetical protein
VPVSAFREIARDREAEFLRRGYAARHVFAHRLYQLPKCGPDGYKLAQAACGESDLSAHWQLLVYADRSLVEEFPEEVFFDDEVNWHRQQFGRAGQVASATVVVAGERAHSLVHQSDLVQRIARIPGHRSRVENRFKGWPQMLLNGLLAFAAERGVRHLHTPTAKLALEHTDPAREVGDELFERVYDRPVERFAPDRVEGWWRIDVEGNADAVVRPLRGQEELREERTVCVCHDVERGYGHRDVDPEFARRADRVAGRHLEEMLAVEAAAGVPATYLVVGVLVPDLQARLRDAGHAVAFHSYDHSSSGQLDECREVDFRIKGYRAPRSRLSGDLSDDRLAFHNFEWLASSSGSLGTEVPALPSRVAKLPILVDDFALHTGERTYEEWEADVLHSVAERPFTSIGLHDCYAHHWLPRYESLLDALAQLARPRTLDDVAGDVFFAHAA